MILISDPAIGKLREVEMFFPFLNMVSQEPGCRLDIGVPGVAGDIGVAIQASRFKDHIDLRRYIVTGRHGIYNPPSVVFSGADELDQHQDDGEGDEDFLDHGVKVRKMQNGGMAEEAMLRPAHAQPCATAQQPRLNGLKRRKRILSEENYLGIRRKVVHKMLKANVLYMQVGLMGVNILPFNQEILCLHSTFKKGEYSSCLLYTSPSPRDRTRSRMPSSA